MLFPRRKWKDVKGYEGIYQVSNLGEVRSLDRYITHKDGRKIFYKGKKLKPSLAGIGYEYVLLAKNGKNKNTYIHRLVALHFVDGYFEGAEVNHKDENKQNNIWTNLEWCDSKYNNNYGTKKERGSESLKKTYIDGYVNPRKGKKNSDEHRRKLSQSLKGKGGKKVLCIELDKPFPSVTSVNEYFGKPKYNSTIYECLRGKRPTAYGYHWKYLEE